jgi:hypothetical protein
MSRSGASYAIAALAAVGALVLVAACKSTTSGNNCGNGALPPSVVGTFALLSYTIGTTTVKPPAASGQLRFHAFTYGVDLSIPSGGVPQNISDSGTYSIVGSSCIQEFSVEGQPNFAGSFQLNADSTFHVSGSANGQLIAGLWKRTS